MSFWVETIGVARILQWRVFTGKDPRIFYKRPSQRACGTEVPQCWGPGAKAL